HLLAIINELLDVARIESGKIEVRVGRVDCREIAESVALAMGPLADEKGLEFNLTLPEADLEVSSDPRLLSQILINLANNAIKFTDDGSVPLQVQAPTADSGARFSVIDTGRGIDDDDKARLFAPFEQVGDSATRRHEGTGLGLYICRRFATMLGGQIEF